MWFCVALRINFKKDMCLKEIRLRAQNMLIVLDLTINIIGGDLYNQMMSTKNLHFYNTS